MNTNNEKQIQIQTEEYTHTIDDPKIKRSLFLFFFRLTLDDFKKRTKDILEAYIKEKETEPSAFTKEKLTFIREKIGKINSLRTFLNAEYDLHNSVSGISGQFFKASSMNLYSKTKEIVSSFYEHLKNNSSINLRKSDIFRYVEESLVNDICDQAYLLLSANIDRIEIWKSVSQANRDQTENLPLEDYLSKIRRYEEHEKYEILQLKVKLERLCDESLQKAFEKAQNSYDKDPTNDEVIDHYTIAARNYLSSLEESLNQAIKTTYQVEYDEFSKIMDDIKQNPCKALKTLMGKDGYKMFINDIFKKIEVNQSTTKLTLNLEFKERPNNRNAFHGRKNSNKPDKDDENQTLDDGFINDNNL